MLLKRADGDSFEVGWRHHLWEDGGWFDGRRKGCRGHEGGIDRCRTHGLPQHCPRIWPGLAICVQSVVALEGFDGMVCIAAKVVIDRQRMILCVGVAKVAKM